MPIEPGGSLLHYRLVEKIGEGGMGVVWKAVDTTLDREVAIKILPEPFAGAGERLARFEREAKVLASLSHPGIAGIYGLHADGQTRFLAMELVAGEELAARIDRGPVPIDEALAIARGIAEALEAAHAAGVIHRDLKPANVKLTPDGKVKVLDFGLAKALVSDPVSGQADPGLSPTLTSAGTLAGMILGTAAYMSPEQARGQAADARADVWALGVVLFEMLCGKRLFHGKTVSDTLASVLKIEPDWAELPRETPAAVRRLLRRCLAKEPEDRLHHVADARIEIREALDGDVIDGTTGSAEPSSPPVSRRSFLPWSVAVIAIVGAAALLWLGHPFSKPTPRATLNLAVPFPPATRLLLDQTGNLAIAPSGRHLAMILTHDGVRQLYLRALDDPRVAPLDGTQNATTPFFSPDSRWVGFISDGKLRKVSVDGATPMTLCDAALNNRGASWGAGDVIVFAPSTDTPLMMVGGSDGAPRAITTLDTALKERSHRWPHVLPDGDAVLFTVGYLDSAESYENSPIDVVRISTGERKRVLDAASSATYAESGHLIFARGGVLFAVPFDLRTLETRGKPVPVTENVMGSRNSGISYMGVSGNGLLAYIEGREGSLHWSLAWKYLDGRTERLSTPLAGYYAPSLSPDGGRIAVEMLGETTGDIWVFDIERETMTRLTFEGNNDNPTWSPDGKWIAFSSDRGGLRAVYRKPADGSGEAELLLADEKLSLAPTSWSPDGRYLAVESRSDQSDIVILSLDDRQVTDFLKTDHDEFLSEFSPDGKWIVYRSDDTGRYEIYVRPFPGPGGKWQVSTDGGEEPHWSSDGRTIYYRRGQRLYEVDVEAADRSFRVGRSREIFSDIEVLSPTQGYAADPHGGRFLTILRTDDAVGPDRVTVVVDWFDELRRKLASP